MRCTKDTKDRPHLFPPARAGEDEGGGNFMLFVTSFENS
jgi:hypothetical protein